MHTVLKEVHINSNYTVGDTGMFRMRELGEGGRGQGSAIAVIKDKESPSDAAGRPEESSRR